MSNALEHGLDILELIAARREARVSEITASVDISRATAFRILGVLEDRGYVVHVRDNPTWRLGPTAAGLAAGLDDIPIAELAEPAMKALWASSGETINLAVLRRRKLVWEKVLDSKHALRLQTTVGAEVPVHATAVGKAILSVIPEDEWPALLGAEPYADITANTHRTLRTLRKDVEAARVLGYAHDREESEIGCICVAAPIIDHAGRPIGAISISTVAGRFTDAGRQRLGEALRDWCSTISSGLSNGGQSLPDAG